MYSRKSLLHLPLWLIFRHMCVILFHNLHKYVLSRNRHTLPDVKLIVKLHILILPLPLIGMDEGRLPASVRIGKHLQVLIQPGLFLCFQDIP